jgi:hypothetical protein
VRRLPFAVISSRRKTLTLPLSLQRRGDPTCLEIPTERHSPFFPRLKKEWPYRLRQTSQGGLQRTLAGNIKQKSRQGISALAAC